MLLEFNVTNFRSFKEKATLSMVATKDKSLLNNTVNSATLGKNGVLASAVIYGANASGKSNFLNALYFMRSFVSNSFREQSEGDKIGVTPFKFDTSHAKKESIFEVVFVCEKIKYVYGFSCDSRVVKKEWLYSYPKNQPRLMFQREQKRNSKEAIVKFGPHWAGPKGVLSKITPSNALVLSVASHAKHKVAVAIVNWFLEGLRWMQSLPNRSSEEEFTKALVAENKKARNAVVSFLKSADFDITGFSIKEVPFFQSRRFSELPERIASDLRKKINDELEDKTEPMVHEVRAIHKGKSDDGGEIAVELEMDDESDGTQKIFALGGPIYHVLSTGCCLVVDELDVKLHPILTRSIVELFHNPKLNKKGAQIIFATHDSSLLDIKQLFRRDQIWFTARQRDGGSQLYSLAEYKLPRKGENVKSSYLAGKYGAVPFITHLNI